MTKDELNKLEKITFTEEIPLLDELYVVVSNKKHDSGYKMYKIYGVAYDNNNETTAAAIEEGRKMMSDSSAPRYSSMDALKEALEV